MKKIIVWFFLAATAPVVSFAQYFTDLFTGASLNSIYWQTLAPASDSSVAQSGGVVAINNRGWLISPPMPAAIDITLKFQFSGSAHDVFNIFTRSITTKSNPFRVPDKAISIQLQMQSDTGQTTNNVSVGRWDYFNTNPVGAQGTFPIALGQAYTLRIVDDGNNVLLYINDTATPFLRYTDNTYKPGTQVIMFNREGAGAGSLISAGSQVKISAFAVNATSVVTVTNTVTNTVTVPDTSGKLVNLSTLGTGGFTMGFVVGGSSAKRMLIRAVGPTLQTFGVANSASQTSITLYSGPSVIGSNTGWSTAPNATQIAGIGGAFALANGSADSAVLATLNPGSYTAQATANGAVLLEVYEAP